MNCYVLGIIHCSAGLSDCCRSFRVGHELPVLDFIIDSLDGLTFRNQLMSIMLVMPTGQHLHALFSFLACP